jgi:glycosyl transferase family 2
MFVLPAFEEPEWIDRCLESIQQQTTASPVVITTSTPNAYLQAVASRRRVPLIVNPESRGIAADWNFALQHGDAAWVTVAHQDDWYEPHYVESCLEAAAAARDAILVFTDATERTHGATADVSNTRVKRWLSRLAFGRRASIRSPFRKRLLLSFGNPIPCPAVMINRPAVPEFRFPEGWKSNLDWSAWVTLARHPGAFVRVPRPLVHRTLHPTAATTRSLAARAIEDDRMFRELWPWPLAFVLGLVYAASRRPYAKLKEHDER